jgi:glutamate---cysteine ligase / carboxylate-amine ligase
MSTDPQTLRARFDAPAPMTVGVEEELFLLDPSTLDLAPRAREVLAALGADPRFTLELPAAQLEIVLPPAATAGEAIAGLAAARRALIAAVDGELRFATSGVHPFTAPLGVLNTGERYDRIAERYGDVARAQLVSALQTHVAVRGADRALAVYNALRAELPLIAALAANAPIHAGRDTGMASVRAHIGSLLPRQGVPPALASWEAYAAALGKLRDPGEWWWEVRPHPRYGTLEIRVPDAQASIDDAGAIVAVVHATVGWLAERFDAGETLPARERWEIEEDRWLAARHGAAGPLNARVHALLDALEPVAERLGCAGELQHARTLAAEDGAQRARACFAARGAHGLTEALADAFERV